MSRTRDGRTDWGKHPPRIIARLGFFLLVQTLAAGLLGYVYSYTVANLDIESQVFPPLKWRGPLAVVAAASFLFILPALWVRLGAWITAPGGRLRILSVSLLLAGLLWPLFDLPTPPWLPPHAPTTTLVTIAYLSWVAATFQAPVGQGKAFTDPKSERDEDRLDRWRIALGILNQVRDLGDDDRLTVGIGGVVRTNRQLGRSDFTPM